MEEEEEERAKEEEVVGAIVPEIYKQEKDRLQQDGEGLQEEVTEKEELDSEEQEWRTEDEGMYVVIIPIDEVSM